MLFGLILLLMHREIELEGVCLCIGLFSLDTTAFENYSRVIIGRPVIEEVILWKHQHPHDLGKLLTLAMKHLSLESFIHAVFGPFDVRIEIEIPVIDAWNLYGVTVQLYRVCRCAAVRVTLLVLENDEEYVR